MGYQLIETIEITAATSGLVSFTSIPQDGQDLLFLGSIRTNRSAVAGYFELQLNAYGDSAIHLVGSGSAASSFDSGYVSAGNPIVNGASSTSNTFSSVSAYIPNYTSSTGKSVSIDAVGENNATEAYQVISAGYKNTTAVTTLNCRVESDYFAAGTTLSLYKITAD
jgi:hypothetical protein